MTNKKIEVTELHNLFDIKHGSKLDLNKMTQCEIGDNPIAFIGRSNEDNAIVAFIEELTDQEPFESGLITVALGGSALASFVQPIRFYTAQNIDVLKPKTEMTLDEKLFYCLCIEANRFRYSTFGREANRTLKNLLVPKLEFIPSWVNGSTKNAIDELNRDLYKVIGA